ncbi:hypothetical protein ASF21_10195 [Arthrobacter sp. Leaf234]|nr:hypothetical protein ASF21_10195 [Arthrobacter sp. Leaf234]
MVREAGAADPPPSGRSSTFACSVRTSAWFAAVVLSMSAVVRIVATSFTAPTAAPDRPATFCRAGCTTSVLSDSGSADTGSARHAVASAERFSPRVVKRAS